MKKKISIEDINDMLDKIQVATIKKGKRTPFKTHTKGILHGHGSTLINDPTITHVLDDPLKHFLELALDKELEYLNPYLDE